MTQAQGIFFRFICPFHFTGERNVETAPTFLNETKTSFGF